MCVRRRRRSAPGVTEHNARRIWRVACKQQGQGAARGPAPQYGDVGFIHTLTIMAESLKKVSAHWRSLCLTEDSGAICKPVSMSGIPAPPNLSSNARGVERG